MIFVLDSSPLGLWLSPNQRRSNERELSQWVRQAISNNHFIAIPEICYYENRRELVRSKKNKSVSRLDEFCLRTVFPKVIYIPISTQIIIKASQLWAWARHTGQQTAHDLELDGDVILAATAITVAQEEGLKTVIVTNNVNHLARYTPAQHWRDIEL